MIPRMGTVVSVAVLPVAGKQCENNFMFDIWHSEKHLSPFCDPFCYLLTNNQESVSFNLFLFFFQKFP